MGIGIYLKAAQALFIGGPIAMILAYMSVGTVAYSLTVNQIVFLLIPGFYWRDYVCSPDPWCAFHDSEPYIITSNWICMRMGLLVQVSSSQKPLLM
jgi:hypothetical protein